MRWIGRLWRGEYSHGKAFWVFGLLISVLWYFATKFLSTALPQFTGKRVYSILARGVLALYLALSICGVAVAVQTWFNS